VDVFGDWGRNYIEGMAGLWCTALDYGNYELIEAATKRHAATRRPDQYARAHA
jgi:adenosylmethionine-8-amino-7-oxononanoate aminotransferase